MPCYNEAQRLDASLCLALLEHPSLHVVFVNDGSTDTTLEVIAGIIAQNPVRFSVLNLQPNRGKAEALRAAMVQHSPHCDWVGYADADFAAPPSEIVRLLDIAFLRDCDAVVGSRVALSGRDIDRTVMRHYLGRVFGTSASLVLGRPFYDTQCGLKWFRTTPGLHRALSRVFSSKWFFDVELLGRLFLSASNDRAPSPYSIHEEPLLVWHDVAGTKLKATDFLAVPRDLLRIRRALRGWASGA